MSEEEILIRELKDTRTQRAAFGVLVDKFTERIYWQIRKLVLSHDDANDILQNVLIKAWNNINSFRGDSKLSTWLYKIALNESITFINKQIQIQNIPLEDNNSFLYNKLESDIYFDGDQIVLRLQKAILSLPEKQRIIFNLKYFSDLKYEEISAILNTSVGALKASYHHASKKIEDFLKNEN